MKRGLYVFVLSLFLALPVMATPLTLTDPTLVGTWSGSDCAGVFGTDFGKCMYNLSPIIAKFDYNAGAWGVPEKNSMFPSITGGEWKFADGEHLFTYTPGPGDPVITHFAWKQANGFKLFFVGGAALGQPLSVKFTTLPYNDTSHLSFYDSAVPVPEPGGLSLLGIGLLTLANRIRKWGTVR